MEHKSNISHGYTKTSSKGICIYCMCSDVTLTDEHIVAFSLGGKHLICKASCCKCADITKKFEQDVARDLWGEARISYEAPSRRKKLRAKYIMLRDINQPGKNITLPYDEYPAPMVFYNMHLAGILQGLPPDYDISDKWQLSAIMDDKKLKMFENKYSIKLTFKFKHVPQSFGRMIAKIGYCQVLCSLDPHDFNPICLPYILGKQENISYIVGENFNARKPIEGMGYVLNPSLLTH